MHDIPVGAERSSQTSAPRLLAFYLPQFHPTPENDEWWGKGFTEWTNVGKSKPLFNGHQQPRVPADLGYYDLRVQDVQIQQSEMAMEYGIEGFCYWHYWFGHGRRMLEMPVQNHLVNKDIKISYCLGWANGTWSGIWLGEGNKILIEQKYPGKDDYIEHFKAITPHLLDPRYFRVDEKPFFLVYSPHEIPSTSEFLDTFREEAKRIGLSGLHIVAYINRFEDGRKYLDMGYDAVNVQRFLDVCRFHRSKITRKVRGFLQKTFDKPKVYLYSDAIKYMDGPEDSEEDFIPTLVPNWDHSPRTGKKIPILHQSTPELFSKHAQSVFRRIANKSPQKKIAIIKSWNEWAEGNYIEPDIMHGKAYLEAIRRNLNQL